MVDEADEWVDAAELLRGLSVTSGGALAGERETAFMLVKVRYADGGSRWILRTPEGVGVEEMLGLLVAQTDSVRERLLDGRA